MTIICALRAQPTGNTWIGSDTLATAGGEALQPKHQKWVLANGCALAVAGLNVFLTTINHFAEELQPEWDGYDVWQWARQKMLEIGVEGDKEKKSEAPWFGCSLIFATPSALTYIDSSGGAVDYSAGEFCARGSGDEYAQGAVFAAQGMGLKYPEGLLKIGIEAACQFSTGCGGEPWIRKLGA